MNRSRIALIGTLLAFAPAMALAQATPADAKKPAADAPAPKAAKKPDAKAAAKPEAKKTAAKKKVEDKDATKAQPAPKKPVKTETAAKPAGKGAPKSTSTTPSGGTVDTYQAGQAPSLRDKAGNAISTAPDAYNVDSARKK